MKSYKKDVDYEFVGINVEPQWAIRILKGKYKNIVVKFDDMKLGAEDGNPLEEGFEDGVDYTLSFNYNILETEGEVDTEGLDNFLGDTLMNAINDGLEDGTAKIESEPKQDDSTIVIE